MGGKSHNSQNRRERDKSIRQERARLKKEAKHHHLSVQSTQEPIEFYVCFYGRQSWYESQVSQLGTHKYIHHLPFDDLPDLTNLDILVVDTLKAGEEYLVKTAFELLDIPRLARERKLNVFLSHPLGQNIADLIQPGMESISYTEIHKLSQYLEALKAQKQE